MMAVALFGSGCIPYHLRETPRFAGTVLNAVTGQPISNARFHYTEFPEEICSSAEDGSFDFSIRTWRLISIVPWDDFSDVHLLIEAPGYWANERSFAKGGLDMTNETVFLWPK